MPFPHHPSTRTRAEAQCGECFSLAGRGRLCQRLPGFATNGNRRATDGRGPPPARGILAEEWSLPYRLPRAQLSYSIQKVEFWSARARLAGLSPLPSYTAPEDDAYPLHFCQGRTLTAFHSFFDEGQALPTLAKANTGPQLWIHPLDAQKRNIARGTPIVISNQHGQFEATAYVTDDILPGVVWMRDGWISVNRVTSGAPIVPLTAHNTVPGIPGRQAAYDAWVEVSMKKV